MTKSYHMGVSVRGALANWTRREWAKVNKATHTADQAKAAFMDQLSQGHEIIPIGPKCDNWDWKEGCQGHEVIEP